MLQDQHLVDMCDAAADAVFFFFTGARSVFPDLTSEGHRDRVGEGWGEEGGVRVCAGAGWCITLRGQKVSL